MSCNIALPEAVEVEEPLGQTFGRVQISAVTVTERVITAQTQTLGQLMIQVWLRGKAKSFLSEQTHK